MNQGIYGVGTHKGAGPLTAHGDCFTFAELRKIIFCENVGQFNQDQTFHGGWNAQISTIKNRAHPSCQPPMDSVFNQSLFFMSYVANQHPFWILKGEGERVRRKNKEEEATTMYTQSLL